MYVRSSGKDQVEDVVAWKFICPCFVTGQDADHRHAMQCSNGCGERAMHVTASWRKGEQQLGGHT